MKLVMRRDGKLIRLARWTWDRGTPGDGKGYSCKLSIGLYPSLFRFWREHEAWFLQLCGLRIHFARSFGGRFPD